MNSLMNCLLRQTESLGPFAVINSLKVHTCRVASEALSGTLGFVTLTVKASTTFFQNYLKPCFQ